MFGCSCLKLLSVPGSRWQSFQVYLQVLWIERTKNNDWAKNWTIQNDLILRPNRNLLPLFVFNYNFCLFENTSIGLSCPTKLIFCNEHIMTCIFIAELSLWASGGLLTWRDTSESTWRKVYTYRLNDWNNMMWFKY